MRNFALTISFLILSGLLAASLKAQVYCAYAGNQCTNGLAPPSRFAQDVTDEICDILDISYIDVYSGRLPNACATTFRGYPIIVYSSDFLGQLSYYNDWAPISVMAHEVGHHYSGDASWFGAFDHPWTKELRADFISGYVLYHMGASLNDAQSAFRVMFQQWGTSSHPDTPRRMAALQQGYRRAYDGY